jgi:hypothetical protein
MRNYSKQHQVQKQSGLNKTKWNDVMNHAASVVEQYAKENKLVMEDAETLVNYSIWLEALKQHRLMF